MEDSPSTVTTDLLSPPRVGREARKSLSAIFFGIDAGPQGSIAGAGTVRVRPRLRSPPHPRAGHRPRIGERPPSRKTWKARRVGQGPAAEGARIPPVGGRGFGTEVTTGVARNSKPSYTGAVGPSEPGLGDSWRSAGCPARSARISGPWSGSSSDSGGRRPGVPWHALCRFNREGSGHPAAKPPGWCLECG